MVPINPDILSTLKFPIVYIPFFTLDIMSRISEQAARLNALSALMLKGDPLGNDPELVLKKLYLKFPEGLVKADGFIKIKSRTQNTSAFIQAELNLSMPQTTVLTLTQAYAEKMMRMVTNQVRASARYARIMRCNQQYSTQELRRQCVQQTPLEMQIKETGSPGEVAQKTIQELVNSDYLIVDGDSYKTKLAYTNGSLKINGRLVPIQRFTEILLPILNMVPYPF